MDVQLEELEKEIEAGNGNKKALAALNKEVVIAEECLGLFFEKYGEEDMQFSDLKKNIKRVLVVNGRLKEEPSNQQRAEQ